MINMLNEVAMVALALPLGALAAQLSQTLYRRCHLYLMARCIWHISAMIMAEEEPSDKEMRGLRLRFPMDLILDSALFISERIYGNSLNRLVLIIEVCELDYYLVRQIDRRSGESRVNNLSKLSSLPYVATMAEYASDYIESDHRAIRFHATAALVSARPDRAIRHIVRFNGSLTLYEVAVLEQLLRRTGAPIAYTPLLLSENRNLQLLGIYICGTLLAVDAEPHLQRLAESEDGEVSYMALQTLCSVRGDISTAQARDAVLRLMPHQRLSFLLHAVQNCYSLRSCAHLLTAEERTLFSQRINSYKCRMVCN